MSLSQCQVDLLRPICSLLEFYDLYALLRTDRSLRGKIFSAMEYNVLRLEKPRSKTPQIDALAKNPFRNPKTLTQIQPLFQTFSRIASLIIRVSDQNIVLDDPSLIHRLPLRVLQLDMPQSSRLIHHPPTILPAYFSDLMPFMQEFSIKDKTAATFKWDTTWTFPPKLMRLCLSLPTAVCSNEFLKQIPSHVKYIELHALRFVELREPCRFKEGLVELSIASQESSNTQLIFPSTLRSLTVGSDPPSSSLVVIGLENMLLFLPPTLEKLVILTKLGLYRNDVNLLPPSLTHLHAPHWSDIGDDQVPNLPRALRMLVIGSCNITWESLQQLPPHLHTFQFIPTEAHMPPTKLKLLPPSITSFDILMDNTEMPVDLPSTIAHLGICNFSVARFPTNITSLSISSSSLGDYIFQALPKTLKKFTAKSLRAPPGLAPKTYDTDCYSKDVPQLEYLYIGDSNCQDQLFSMLPSSIKFCYVESASFTTDCLESIPSCLETLFISQISLSKNFVDKQFLNRTDNAPPISVMTANFVEAAEDLLPSHLRRKSVGRWAFNIFHHMQSFSHLNVRSIDASFCHSMQRLPPELALYEHYGEVFQELSWPRTLDRLVVYPNHTSADLNHLHLKALPCSLTHLEIGHFMYLNTLIHHLARLSQLVTLKLPKVRGYEKKLDFVSPVIQTLHIPEIGFPFAAIYELSKTASDLDLSLMDSFEGSENDSIEVARLPPSITRLKLSGMSQAVHGPCTLLLQFCKHGFVYTPNLTHTIDRFTFRSNFLSTSLANSNLAIPKLVNNLPLTTLILNEDTLLTDNLFDRLSETISIISMPLNTNLTVQAMPRWPKKLKSIKLGALNYDPADVSQTLSNFPDLKSYDSNLLLQYYLQVAASCGMVELEEISVCRPGFTHALGSVLVTSLPPKCTAIDLPFYVGFSNTDIGKLPKTVTSIRLESCGRLSSSSFQSLPPKISELVIPNCHLDANHQLHQTVTHVDFRYSKNVPSAFFEQLPVSLLYLDVSEFQGFQEAHIDKLPKNLTYFKVGLVNLNGKHLFEFYTSNNTPFSSCILDFPNVLQAALVAFPKNLTTHPTALWGITSLMDLLRDAESCSRIYLPSRSFSLPTVNVEFGHVYRTDHTLAIQRTDDDESGVAKFTWIRVMEQLSSTLDPKKSAIVRKCAFMVDPSLLPPINFPDSVVPPLETGLDRPLRSGMVMPPFGACMDTGNYKPYLPPSAIIHDKVSELALHFASYIEEEMVQEFPRNLIALILPNSNELSFTCFPLLPTTLIHLELPLKPTISPESGSLLSQCLTDDIYPSLPATLQFVKLGGYIFTRDENDKLVFM